MKERAWESNSNRKIVEWTGENCEESSISVNEQGWTLTVRHKGNEISVSQQQPGSAFAVDGTPAVSQEAAIEEIAKRLDPEETMLVTDMVQRYFERHGYTIIDRAWLCGYGSIDLIARDEGSLIFIELAVRDKAGDTLGVDLKKEKATRCRQSADLYMRSTNAEARAARYDFVTVKMTSPNRPTLAHLVNACPLGQLPSLNQKNGQDTQQKGKR